MRTRRAAILARAPGSVVRRFTRARAREADERLDTELAFDPRAPALILSPHWDDAVLSCWSLLDDRELELSVLNVFGGVPPTGTAGAWESLLGVRDSAERARARIAEDARALARASRTAANLPLLEARLRSGAPAPSLAQLDRVIAGEAASVSHVHAPAGIGAHADHLLLRRYALALRRAGIGVSLYAELPYCVLHGWPRWVDDRDVGPRRDVDAHWGSFVSGVPGMPPLHEGTVAHLDAESAERKRAAIEGYEASLNYGVRRMLADPYFHANEVRWELAPAPAE